MADSATRPLAGHTVQELLDTLGAKVPAPGGGAAAAMTGALSASLGLMVVNYSLGKKNLAMHQADLERAADALARMSTLLTRLGDEDAMAYAAVSELGKLSETDARRQREYPAAVSAAIAAPSGVVAACCDLLRLFELLVPMTNRHLRSDLAIAAILADAGARSGWWNVKVNLPLLGDAAEREAIAARMAGMLAEGRERCGRVEGACGE